MSLRFLVPLYCLLLWGCPSGSDSTDDTNGSAVDGGSECRAAAPTVSPETLPDGTVDVAYSQQLTAFGGEEVFSVTDGALPDGLTLSEAGLISGTPSVAGEFQFSVSSTVDDSEAECAVHPAFADNTLTIADAG